jgi:hypothetical protein
VLIHFFVRKLITIIKCLYIPEDPASNVLIAYISREEKDDNQAPRAAENLPIEFLEENVILVSEDEIDIANIYMKKQVDNEQRTARKILKAVTNGVDAATHGEI